MFRQGLNEVSSKLRILDVFEHEFDSLNDLVRIILLDLAVVKLLHIVVLLRGEAEHLSLCSRPLILDYGEPLPQVDRSDVALINIHAVSVVALDELRHPGKHG